MSRTRTLLAGTAAAALLLTACGGGDGDNGDNGGDGNAAGGGEVHVSLPNHTWTDAIQERIGDFEDKTGITVNLTTFGEDQLSDQYNVKLNTGSSDFDVMMYRPLQEGKMFVTNGWLANLDDNITANADWDWDDFQDGPVGAVTDADSGSVYGVPLVTEREILYYNKEILADAGVEVPTTMEEFEAAVEATTDKDAGIFGWVSRGQRSAAVTQFSSFLYSMGGDWDDVASPEAIAAYELYSGLLRDYGPAGTTEMSWPQALPVFAQGNAAFYTDADSLYNNFMDPENSNVVDTIGFAQFPAGPAGSKPYNVPSWALGINEFSENKENAWAFLEWATSPETSLDIQSSGVPLARASVWANPESTASFPEELVEVINASAEVGVGYDRPNVIRVSEARDIVGTPIVEGIEGRDVAAAAQKAKEDYEAFLETDG
ncbi:sugar ABC transporter substrate-binding protein [Tessaracoccus terricola]